MKKTRFRAYQLGDKGSSFSYSVDNKFTMIEARLNKINLPNILSEMRTVGASNITSWDEDHCSQLELPYILQDLRPEMVQYPGYDPDSDCGKVCKKMIEEYCAQQRKANIKFTPEFVRSLSAGQEGGYNTIIYNPIMKDGNHNDNSIVAFFRSGRFTVMSLGDCESHNIAKRIQSCTIATKETDVLILAHHGADNGFTTDEFIKAIKPRIAICSSNYDNQYEHPKDKVRQILYQNGVRLFTTKTGDVIVECNEDNLVRVNNLISCNETISSSFVFSPRYNVQMAQV